MNGKQQAIDKITDFMKSDRTGMLITGTHQYKKHYKVMALINKHYKNAKVLYRINGMANIDDRNFSPLSKRPKAGEIVRLENNYYVFDAFTSRATWSKTMHHDYDFAIVYPIDAICRKGNIEPIQELLQYRKVGKLFLCSWTDHDDYDYTMFSSFFTDHVIYDAEEEDVHYHNRVLGLE